jgi:transcription antitermination factor NusG
MFESRGVNSGCEWGNCVDVVVGDRVRVRSGEFGIEKGVED